MDPIKIGIRLNRGSLTPQLARRSLRYAIKRRKLSTEVTETVLLPEESTPEPLNQEIVTKDLPRKYAHFYFDS